MIKAEIPANEEARLDALQHSHLLNTPLEQGFERITQITKRIFDVPIAAISLIDKDMQWFKSVVGLEAKESPRELTFCAHTILNDQWLIVDDAQTDDRFADNPMVIQPPSLRFYAGYPIHAGSDQRIGALCIMDRRPRQMSSYEKAILKDMASLVDIEIRNHQFIHDAELILHHQGAVKRAAFLDQLTKLWNKEGVSCILEQRISKYQQDPKSAFGLIILSVDSLQSFSEEYGQKAGEDLLKAIAQALVNYCRGEDSIAYVGGKEFMVIASVKQPEDMHAIADRIRTSLYNESLLTRAGPVKITVTAGLAYYNPDKHTKPDTLINDAKSALKEGKESGGNQTVLH